MDNVHFGHLHIHSEYSLLDSCVKIDELFATVKELKQKFCCITDHGSTSGLWEAQKAGERHGIKPLLGTEFYYQRENDHENGHLVVIAKNNKGLENIFKLQEYAYVHNFYYKPRIKWEMLKQLHEGLIVTTACIGSTFNQYLLDGEIQKAIAWAKKFKQIFNDDFYIEIQPLDMPEQVLINQHAANIAKQLNIKTIATNDVHYISENDAFPHEVLLALQINKKMSDEKRWKFPTNDLWLKSTEEMINTFVGLTQEDILAAMNNTVEIANKCNAKLLPGKYLPKFYNIPEDKTERNLLAKEIMKGAKRTGFINNPNYMKEVQNELNVIDRNGYSGYFLIVQDYVNTARQNGIIVGDGRGSGAGSKIAFLTDISRIEPSKYNLLFERFMADGRSPDFDVDFSDQDAVFEDLQKKYGIENVARIVTFGKMTPKAICRKVLSCFEHNIATINYISKLIPNDCNTLDNAYQQSPQLLNYKEKYKVEFEVIERLEGVISHEAQHAGGVIIYPNLSSILPIKTKGNDRTKRIVAFDKDMLEELGHYKFDILGLETLPVIKRCLNSIKEFEGKDIDLYTIDYNDKNIYTMLCQGDVSGVFQLSNQAQKVIEQQPQNFNDLIAINALIRPGVGDWEEYIARRKGKKWSVHKARFPYLKETEGLIAYQEQYLLDAKVLANWDLAFADKYIRKNKHIAEDIELRNKFIEDCKSNGVISQNLAIDIWKEIVDTVSQGYGFNKSHSTSYAVISFQTAWLKYYYPEHFYASLMSSEKTDSDGQSVIANYIAECKQKNIKILPPDINFSGENFVVTKGGVNYRITAIKHVGENAIRSIEALKPINSFDDFMQRREKRFIKKNTLINLIKAGCFDFDNPNRAELLWQVDMYERTKTQIKQNYQCPPYKWNDRIKAEWEKEVLGMYLSTHPMEKYGFKPLNCYKDGGHALQGGEIYDIKIFNDRNGNEMAFVFLDTLFGNVKVIVFASSWRYKNIQKQIQIGNIVLMRGRRSGNDLLLNSMEVLEEKGVLNEN